MFMKKDYGITRNAWKIGGHYVSKIKRILAMLVIMVLTVEVFAFPVMAEDTSRKMRTIRVGYYENEGFQEYDEKTGEYSGYSYEFLKAVQQYTDWNYEFVPCDFYDGLTMLENGELDIMNNVSKTDEREAVLDFTSLYSGENEAYLVMKPGDNRVAYDDFQAMEGIKIGLAANSIYSDRLVSYFEKNGINANIIWYDARDEVTEAFEQGTVDAYVITSSTKADEHIILSFSPDMYYIATTKGNSDIIQTLDSAIVALRENNPELELRIRDKYYGVIAENYTVLTDDERDYLEENPIIRVSYQPEWYPLCYQDENGNFAGAVRGVYDLLEKRTGFKFEYVPIDNDDDSNNITTSYDAPIVAELPGDFTYTDKYHVKLTKPFVSPPLVEMSEHLLVPGDSIALAKGDYLSELCKNIYGDEYVYEYYEDVSKCVEAVKNGKADGTVLLSYESEFYRNQRGYMHLAYTIIDEGSYGLSIAVSNDADPRLYQIIQKGLNSISTGEISNIFNNTLMAVQKDDIFTIMYKNPVQSALILVLLAAMLAGLLLGGCFIGKLKRKNEIINIQNEKLVLANRASNDFFARMSHDMRTPLNGILGSAELAIAEEGKSPEVTEHLNDIKFSGDFLLNLINDVLDISKIESGAMELFPETYTYSAFVSNMTKMIEPLCREKNITLNMNPLEGDMAINVDIMRFQQIFFNIFSNAIKYTPEGGTIDHYTEIEPLDEKHLDCKCHIADNGIGMSEEFQEHLFDPYTREHQKNSTSQGTGLGLNIASQLAHMMGGELIVKSELGKGTEVIIHTVLEIADMPDTIAEKEKDTPAKFQNYDLSGSRILLCEDHPLNAKIAVKLLKKWNAVTETAENGEIGVKMFTDSAPGYYDLVLMDIRMPVMDGLDAAKRIRASAHADASRIPIVAMTANAYESDIKQALDAGMNAHLSKPIEPEKMYETIHKFVKTNE